MKSEANSVEEYLEKLSPERREALAEVRRVIQENLPEGFEEEMNWGMICYQVPLATFSDTYNKQPLMYAALASQKNHMAVYLSCIYSDGRRREWFEDAYRATGKRIDMGKSCVRFRKLEDLPVDLIGQVIGRTSLEEFLEVYRKAKKR
ncbi:MAG: DUF1801 domain-containing protein [Acidobacteriota bacterium]|nr:MAG: DUF1801 domain-containing protein [Acidobacteriota bacterium]